MRRETIAPPSGMAPPAGWGPWVQDETGAGGEVADASVEGGVPTRGTCACPICGLDLSSWTLPDRETHADACVSRALESDAMASPPAWGGRHDRAPPAETRAETRAETTARVSSGDVRGGACDAFLNRHGLARYAPAFAREALFPSDLISLTREDLREVLGVRDERDAATFFAAVRGSGRRPSRDDVGRQTTTSAEAASFASSAATKLCREDARLASLEQHDDEWTRVAMAMSASMREVKAPPPTADAKPPRASRENAENEKENENENEANGVDRSGRSVLEAARALGKRSVPSSLWGAAGHGGRDRVIPEWVLGGEKPSAG